MTDIQNLKTIEDFIRCDSISKKDKNRILQCFSKVKTWVEMGMEDPYKFANTTATIGDRVYVFSVKEDRSISLIQILDASKVAHVKIKK